VVSFVRGDGREFRRRGRRAAGPLSREPSTDARVSFFFQSTRFVAPSCSTCAVSSVNKRVLRRVSSPSARVRRVTRLRWTRFAPSAPPRTPRAPKPKPKPPPPRPRLPPRPKPPRTPREVKKNPRETMRVARSHFDKCIHSFFSFSFESSRSRRAGSPGLASFSPGERKTTNQRTIR